MTIYVARGFTYYVQISAEVALDTPTSRGVSTRKIVVPELAAQFKNRPMLPAVRFQALRKLKQANPRIGSPFDIFERDAGLVTDPSFLESLDPTEDAYHEPYQPEMRFGIFDTENVGYDQQANDIVPWQGRMKVPDWRHLDGDEIDLQELYDRELRVQTNGLGREYVEYETERLAAPWPAYDLEAGQGSHDRKFKTAVMIGADLAYCIAYEQQRDKPSQGFIKLCEDELRRRAAAEAEQGAFTAPIPQSVGVGGE